MATRVGAASRGDRPFRSQAMVSLVIPVYNESSVLPLLRQRLVEAAASWGEPFEVILVNDGSLDKSLEIMLDIHSQDPRFKVMDLSRNFGHQAAVAAGLACAAGDGVMVLDADLQDPPEVLNQFLEKWRAGYDIVYGIRTHRQESLIKRACYHVYYRFLGWLANIPIPLDAGDFCFMSRQAVDAMNRLPERTRFIRGLRKWIGFRHFGLPYKRQVRAAGAPKYTWRKLVRLGLSGILSFSKFPLRIASIVGLIIASLALGASILFLVLRLTGWTFMGYDIAGQPGLATMIISLYLLTGVQLICLGIMGEYLGQIVEEVKARPLAVIRRTYGIQVKAYPPFITGPADPGEPLPPGESGRG